MLARRSQNAIANLSPLNSFTIFHRAEIEGQASCLTGMISTDMTHNNKI